MTNFMKLGTRPVLNIHLGDGSDDPLEARIGKKLVYRKVDFQWGFGYHLNWAKVYTLKDYNDGNTNGDVIDQGDWWEVEIVDLPTTAQNLYIYMQTAYLHDYNISNTNDDYTDSFVNIFQPHIALYDFYGNVIFDDTVIYNQILNFYYDPAVHGDKLRFRIYRVNDDAVTSTSMPYYLYFILLPENTTGSFIDRFKMIHTNTDSKERLYGVVFNMDSGFDDRGMFFITNHPIDDLDYINGSHFMLIGMQPNKKFRIKTFNITNPSLWYKVNRYDIFNGNVYLGNYNNQSIEYTVPPANDFSGTIYYELLKIQPNDTSESMEFVVFFDFDPHFNENDTSYQYDFPHLIEYNSLVKDIYTLNNVNGHLEKYYSHKLLNYTGGTLFVGRIQQEQVDFTPNPSSTTFLIGNADKQWLSLIEVDSNGNFVDYKRVFTLLNNSMSSYYSIGSGNYLVLRRGAVKWSDPAYVDYTAECLICGNKSGNVTEYLGWKLSSDGTNYSNTVNIHKHVHFNTGNVYYFKHEGNVNDTDHVIWLPIMFLDTNSIKFEWTTTNCDVEVNLKDRDGEHYSVITNGQIINSNYSLAWAYVGFRITSLTSTPYTIDLTLTVS